MKVLFDQGTPVPLRRALPGHDVSTAYEMGWSALTNGDLLAAAEAAGFAAIVTTDKSIGRNAARVAEALGTVRPGAVVEVTFDA